MYQSMHAWAIYMVFIDKLLANGITAIARRSIRHYSYTCIATGILFSLVDSSNALHAERLLKLLNIHITVHVI